MSISPQAGQGVVPKPLDDRHLFNLLSDFYLNTKESNEDFVLV